MFKMTVKETSDKLPIVTVSQPRSGKSKRTSKRNSKKKCLWTVLAVSIFILLWLVFMATLLVPVLLNRSDGNETGIDQHGSFEFHAHLPHFEFEEDEEVPYEIPETIEIPEIIV